MGLTISGNINNYQTILLYDKQQNKQIKAYNVILVFLNQIRKILSHKKSKQNNLIHPYSIYPNNFIKYDDDILLFILITFTEYLISNMNYDNKANNIEYSIEMRDYPQYDMFNEIIYIYELVWLATTS